MEWHKNHNNNDMPIEGEQCLWIWSSCAYSHKTKKMELVWSHRLAEYGEYNQKTIDKADYWCRIIHPHAPIKPCERLNTNDSQ